MVNEYIRKYKNTLQLKKISVAIGVLLDHKLDYTYFWMVIFLYLVTQFVFANFLF